MGLVDSINQLITEHGSAAILKERLMLLRDQMEKLENENQRLQTENAELKQSHDDLQARVKEQSATEEYVKHRGVLFLRLPNGDIQDEVYCPKCRNPMSAFERFLPFECEPCKVTTGFNGSDLTRVIAEIR